jgi:hypothetical protein
MSTTIAANPMRVLKVSPRDRAIYQSVMVDGKSQRAMAVEHKLSQPRVSAIIKRVGRWLSQGVPPGFGELYRRDRLRAVARLHRMRLEQMYLDTYAAWQKSGETTHMIHEKVVKGEVVSRDTKVLTRPLDPRYTRALNEIRDRIVAFEGFDKLGKVDESCDGRIYEEPERTPVDTYREVKRRTILGGFDTPGDEGIPGLWGAEMVQRNAEVGEGRSKKAECRSEEEKEIAERQLASPALSSVLRGEGRGEGPALREDEGRSEKAEARSEEEGEIKEEYPPHKPAITSTTTQQSCNQTVITPTELLSKKLPVSAQVPLKQAVTTSPERQKSLSPNPPKGPRFRLMGTAAEMAESLDFDEYFSPEQRAARAYVAAMERRQEGRVASRACPHPNPLP